MSLKSISKQLLRKWGLPTPGIIATKQPIENRNWHVNSIGMTMLKIPAGSFVRRDSTFPADAVDQIVSISRSFLLSDREVSRAQFQKFIDDSDYPDAEKPERWKPANWQFTPTVRHPIRRMSWYDAVLFCNWLSRREGLTVCYVRTGKKEELNNTSNDAWKLVPGANGYRLPTEAEWEYSCRAGTATKFSFGDEDSMFDRYGVYRSTRTQLPASKLPNGWGLFDVHGNVAEWCYDWATEYGKEATQTDPMGPPRGILRRVRGGSFSDNGWFVGSGSRHATNATHRVNGLRPARTIP